MTPIFETSFDEDWLARSTRTFLSSEGETTIHRLKVPMTGETWLIASARWASQDACRRLEQEIDFGDRLDTEWARAPVALIKTGEGPVAIYPDTAGAPLLSTITHPIEIEKFLKLGAAIALALGRAHAARLIHRAIRPGNILVDAHGQVRLSSFGDSIIADQDKTATIALWRDSDMPYAAPEESRRNLPSADQRSDLYSLGVTLYELLTHKLPLEAGSPAEWLHAHVAVQPTRPELVRSDIPVILGDLILKLLAKDPADRYQSSAGLHADLVRCRNEWAACKSIEPFELGAADARLIPTGSQALFGRADQIASLAQAFRRVAGSHQSEIVLVSGAAGAGKSALLGKLPSMVRRPIEYFAQGKSELLQADVPYWPLAMALRSLTAQLLSKSESEVDRVRSTLLAGLAGHGRLIVDLVPEIEILIGTQPTLPDLPVQQAQSRIHAALSQTLSAFATDGTPLLFFLDDLQWADEATILFLKTFAGSLRPDILLVLAYRDDETAGADTAEAIRTLANDSGIRLTEIIIAPLSVSDVTDLTLSVLHGIEADTAPLAALIHEKTGGNPFFINQLLRTLTEDRIIRHDSERQTWHWDLEKVAAYQHSDNVIDLMIRRLHRLPNSARDVVRQMACIGTRCDEVLLARMSGMTTEGLRQLAAPALDAGLLNRDNLGYAFPHDRILEASYALTPSVQRPLEHARIANCMIELWGDRRVEKAFEIASQIEQSDKTALPRQDIASYVETLLLAARKARNAAAVDQASTYLAAAKALLGQAGWQTHYHLKYDASLLGAECHLARADLTNAHAEIDELLTHAQAPIERARAFRLMAVLQTVRSNYDGAIESALAGLSMLNIDLPRRPDATQLASAYAEVTAAVDGREITDLESLPVADDVDIEVAMELLSTLASSFFVEGGLSFLHLAKIVELTLIHGATPACAYGLAWFGVYIAHHYEAYTDGRAFAEVALRLIDRHGYDTARTATLVALDQVLPWTAPISYGLARAREAVAAGFASGDVGMACYACNHVVSDVLVMGEYLPLVEGEIERAYSLTRQIGYRDVERIINAQNGVVGLLRRGTQPTLLTSPADQKLIDENGGLISKPTLFWELLYAGMGEVYRGAFERATAWLRAAEPLLWSLPAHINVADYHLFSAIAEAQAFPDAADTLSRVTAHRDRLAGWALINPGTFKSKTLLVEAEIARIHASDLEAIAFYDQAASIAVAAGFVHEQALAHELAGRLCSKRLLTTAAAQHLRLSRDSYRRWGADAMVALLESRHAVLAGESGSLAIGSASPGQGALDLAAAMEAAQALSEEIVFDRLIEILMQNMIVHAGARQGILVLIKDGAPIVEAIGHVVDQKVAVTLAARSPTPEDLPMAVLNTVMRTRKTVVYDDASTDAQLIRRDGGDTRRTRSMLCLPLLKQGELIGILYLENSLAPGVFTPARTNMLEILAAQAAISLVTANLYAELVEENALRARTEASLRTARAELAKTSHLTVMGGLAASIAHEINQPLSVIVSNAGASLRWLRRPVPDVAEALSSLQNIRDDGLRAAGIVKALRALAKQAPLVLVPTKIDDIIGEVLNLTSTEIEAKRVSLSTTLRAGTNLIRGDNVQLQQVLFNLITNAVEAMEGMPPASRDLFITSSREENSIVVRVRDTGPGISAAEAGQIFDPFFTTKESGMGMGLAICRSIVEAHGGTLDASSHAAGGTTFLFRIPVFFEE